MGNSTEKFSRGEQPYDVAEFYDPVTKIIKMPDIEIPLNPKGIGYDLFEIIPEYFGKIAQRDVITDEIDTFDDLFIRSIRTAIKLKDLGFNAGDIASLCSFNNLSCASVHLGIIFAGGIPAHQDPSMNQKDIELLVAEVNPKFIFVSDEIIEKIELTVENLQINTKIVVFGDSSNHLEYKDFTCEQNGEKSFQPHQVKSLDDVACILFSSGTTGVPKAICISDRFIQYHSCLAEPTHVMAYATLYWFTGNITMITMLKAGGVRSINRYFDPNLSWKHILKYNVEMIQMCPFEALQLNNAKPDAKIPLKHFQVGGYQTFKEDILMLRKEFEGVIVGNFYAMTETGLLFMGIDPISYAKVTSVGIPLPNIHYKIVDPETNENLGFNQRGELRIKSKYIFSGFLNKDSTESFDSEGFFKTGDIVYYDEDFSFFSVDRIKEVIKYKRHNIVPAELETILCSHPEISRGVILGVPNSPDGNHICAVVVLEKGSKLTPEEIETFYNEKVEDDGDKITAGVRFLNSIPLTPTGKINRLAVKKIVLDELSK